MYLVTGDLSSIPKGWRLMDFVLLDRENGGELPSKDGDAAESRPRAHDIAPVPSLPVSEGRSVVLSGLRDARLDSNCRRVRALVRTADR